MKTAIKILIATAAILLMIGAVSAADLTDTFKAPSGFTASGNDTFIDGHNHNIHIFNYTHELYAKLFEKDSPFSISNFKYVKYFERNTDDHYGVLEVVEKDGNKYIIDSWTSKSPNESNALKKNLQAFNKANDLKPIEV